MSDKAATEDRLAALHNALAERMIADLAIPANCTPAFLSAVAKFLKDNHIEADVSNPAMKQAKTKLENVVKFPFDPTKQANSA